VNSIHPGFIETPMTASAPAAFRESNLLQIPLGRTGTPADVAPLVVFLMSDESSFISGAEIPGGRRPDGSCRRAGHFGSHPRITDLNEAATGGRHAGRAASGRPGI
jgi:3alpha(or 20beta)-hydroxysteroid dehydrogenase